MRPETRSVLIAVIAGMMASGYLDSTGKVDLGFGFPEGGFMEGASIAIIGAVGGFAILMAFRLIRKMAGSSRAD